MTREKFRGKVEVAVAERDSLARSVHGSAHAFLQTDAEFPVGYRCQPL